MRPDFTDEENYVIAYYRDKNVSSASRMITLDATRILVATGVCVYGLTYSGPIWIGIAFALLLYGELKRMLETGRYVRIFRSILRKFEEALSDSSRDTIASDQDAASKR